MYPHQKASSSQVRIQTFCIRFQTQDLSLNTRQTNDNLLAFFICTWQSSTRKIICSKKKKQKNITLKKHLKCQSTPYWEEMTVTSNLHSWDNTRFDLPKSQSVVAPFAFCSEKVHLKICWGTTTPALKSPSKSRV